MIVDWYAKRQELLDKLLQVSRAIGQIEGQMALCDEQLAAPPTGDEQPKE